jgi:hypothetical protein
VLAIVFPGSLIPASRPLVTAGLTVEKLSNLRRVVDALSPPRYRQSFSGTVQSPPFVSKFVGQIVIGAKIV